MYPSTAAARSLVPTAPSNAPPEKGWFAYHGVWAPGVRLFRQLKFATQALLIAIVFAVPMVALLGHGLWTAAGASMRERMDATRQHVEAAHGVLQWAHRMETSGQATREQAQRSAMQAIERMRYDGDEYFWINDLQMRMVMHPVKPALDGQDVSGIKDPAGRAVFRLFVEQVRRDGKGFVAYQWPKPGSEEPVDKISYVLGFEPWGWLIGSGVYVGDLQQGQRRTLAVTGSVVAAVLLLAGYLFLSFYRVMDGGLRETRRHLRAMASGDLTSSPSPWGRDEAAELMLELRAMQDSLRGMVLRVRRASSEIVHSSSEIASGAANLSARTEQTAANLEQSAASMEQISSAVKSTAAHTDEASRTARRNAEMAVEGGRVMHDVVSTMEGIRTSSSRIGEIIGTIDAIAFQTNILALNAAVEAARAGEQGRGFAVVAGEVRTLARRSADAAREIKALIGGSVEQVEAGAGIVRQAGGTIEQIVASSRRVDELLGEVSGGAREQSQGVAQIGQSVQELDRMTQQNAALVEETAAAAAAMQQLARDLQAEVDRFRLPAGAALAAHEPEAASVDDFDFSGAIEAHRAWKVKLRTAIAEHQHLDAGTIARDDCCPLGRWIHGPGGARWGSRPTFGELLGKHAEFHREAASVAQRINAGRYDEAERLIAPTSAFARISTEVTSLLTRAMRGL